MSAPEQPATRPAASPRAGSSAPGRIRRAAILAALEADPAPHPGDALAAAHRVSRQVIVHDVAVLRAEGSPIIATVRGYVLAHPAQGLPHRAVVAVRHRPDETEDELLAIVDVGVRVANVIVEHPVYGELRGELQLSSPAEVRDWVASTRRSRVRYLSELTDGVHLHTLEATSETALQAARDALASRGYLLNGEDGHP